MAQFNAAYKEVISPGRLTLGLMTTFALAPGKKRGASELFSLIKQGRLRLHIKNTCQLRDAASTHADIEAGKTVGSVVLTA
ncbi:zinc-binding dehydrogenase [Noviherbaspirillum sedimenti]|uniref:Zinc-binding dehydrogenase n=1 Tax=Noviherbaspirillum sedimenti TaxID=2320865 RepID=A0A3A3G167_9BURK|nr:zinc-binding dehydrogenase [Noviherbaspirillum sedimenti]RJG01375.1 hypothetical protein D3878_07070 [Noviherbaspirillum sedimenti]